MMKRMTQKWVLSSRSQSHSNDSAFSYQLRSSTNHLVQTSLFITSLQNCLRLFTNFIIFLGQTFSGRARCRHFSFVGHKGSCSYSALCCSMKEYMDNNEPKGGLCFSKSLFMGPVFHYHVLICRYIFIYRYYMKSKFHIVFTFHDSFFCEFYLFFSHIFKNVRGT